MFDLIKYRKYFDSLNKREFYILMNTWFDFLENKNIELKNKKILPIFELIKNDYSFYLMKKEESKVKSSAGKKGAAKRWNTQKKQKKETKNNIVKIENDNAIEEKDLVIKANIKDSVLRIFQE